MLVGWLVGELLLLVCVFGGLVKCELQKAKKKIQFFRTGTATATTSQLNHSQMYLTMQTRTRKRHLRYKLQ